MASTGAEPGSVYNPFMYGAEEKDLERFILLGLFVAGKNAKVQEAKLDEFLQLLQDCVMEKYGSYFELIRAVRREWDDTAIDKLLRQCKAGKYNLLSRGILHLTNLDGPNLVKDSREELCQIPGVSRKTASFFIMFSREGQRMACLDTHILAYLRDEGIAPDAPRTTPGSLKRYLELEKLFLAHCDELERNPAELDFEIWKARHVGRTRP